MMDCLRKITAKHGIKGLFTGMTAPLVAISPVFAIYFWGFDLGQKIVRRATGSNEVSLGGVVFAGAFSAIPGAFVLLPFDLIKVKLQVELAKPVPQFKGPVDCLMGIIHEEGVRGVWKGTGAMLIREIPSTAAYYTTYELIKRPLQGKDRALSPIAIITAGGFAGMANWIVAIPPDVIKTRYQTAPLGKYPGGLQQVTQELIATEGITALFKGLTPALARAFPSNAACFLGMEVTRKAMDKYI